MVTGVKKLGGTLGSVTAGGLKVFTAGIGAASTGLSALGAASFKAGSNFEAEMSKVSAISGATADDLNALKEKAKEMGASTKFSATESAYALEYMAMAGWKTEDMLSGIEGIMNLAAASGEDLATTSDIVTDALTAFGLSASDSGHFADVLAKASSNANTNVSMLGESFKYVAPVAGALGYSAEDTAIALGIMANAGIKGSQSGTALRSSLTRLVKPTDEAAAMMEEYNLTMTNSDGSMKSLGQVMDMLRGNLGDLTEAEQAQAAAQIFGQEAMSGMLAIINASDSDYAKLTDAIYNADGAARQMAETMQDNLQGSITILKSALEGLEIELYESAESGLSEMVKIANSYVDELSNAFRDGGYEGLARALGEILADITTNAAKYAPQMIELAVQLINSLVQGIIDNLPELASAAGEIAKAILDGIGDLCPALKPITDALQVLIDNFDLVLAVIVPLTAAFVAWKAAVSIAGLINAFTKALNGMTIAQKIATMAQNLLNASMLANPIVLIVTLIAGLVAAFIYLWNTNEEFRQFWIDLWESIKEVAGLVIDAIVGFFTETIPNAISRLVDFVKNNWQSLLMLLNPVTLLAGIFRLVYDNCDEFRAFIDRFVQGIKKFFVNAWDDIKNKFSRFCDFFVSVWESAKETFSNIVDSFVEFFTETIPNAISAFCQHIKDVLVSAWQSVLSFFTETLPALPNQIAYWLGYALGTIIKWGLDLVEWATTNIPLFIEKIITFFSELPGKIWDFLVEIIDSVISWGEEMLQNAEKAATDFINALVTFFTELPGKVAEIFTEILTNIIGWGTEMLHNAERTATDFINTLVTFFSELPGRLLEILTQILSNVINWGNNMLLKAQKTGMDFVNGIINFLKELPGKIRTLLNEIIKKVTSFVTDMANKATEAGKGFFDKIVEALAGLPGKMYEIGSNIVSGIWNGISAGWDWLVGKVKDLANSLFEGAKEALDIHSPSRKFKWLAEMCVAGFDEGIEDLMNPAYMTKNINASLSAMKSNFSGTKAAGVAGYGDFKQTININREISTPDELARAVRVEMRYGLMRGVPVG
ncbi:MAG: phage tail tape measure protein [Lachnospiraceae bacterium]